MYEELTWYLPILRKAPGERYIRKFIDVVLAFAEAHEELKDEDVSQPSPDISALDGPVAAARIIRAARDPHAGDGSEADPFTGGYVIDLLVRLNEIDIRDARRDMIRITIKGTSGYTAPEYAYRDELTITRTRIFRDYEPRIPSEVNPPRQWSYPLGLEHRQIWEDLITAVIEILHRGAASGMFDVGSRTFTVTYADGSEEERVFFLSSFAFKKCYELIDKLLPYGSTQN